MRFGWLCSLYYVGPYISTRQKITIYNNNNDLEDGFGELEHGGLVRELLVDERKGVDLVLNIGLLSLVEVNLKNRIGKK